MIARVAKDTRSPPDTLPPKNSRRIHPNTAFTTSLISQPPIYLHRVFHKRTVQRPPTSIHDRRVSGRSCDRKCLIMAKNDTSRQWTGSTRRARSLRRRCYRPPATVVLVPHPVSWTQVWATRLGVARTPLVPRGVCDKPASRGASTGCSARRIRRRRRARRRDFETPGRRRLAP